METKIQKSQKYITIQNEVVSKYRIDICNGTKCENDWSRTHAHIKNRRVCKWKQKTVLPVHLPCSMKLDMWKQQSLE